MTQLQRPTQSKYQGYVAIGRRSGTGGGAAAGGDGFGRGEGVGGDSAGQGGVVVDVEFEEVEDGVGEGGVGAVDFLGRKR